MNAALPQTTLRKGWCPGALRPMMARDGLLVRLRITGGILTSLKARAIADLAARHGRGLFDLSARANLQMRGVREDALPGLWSDLQALDILDANSDAESVRNVIASPLAGLHGGHDIRPLVAALEAKLGDDTTLHALPTKFGFLVDDGVDPSLADVQADVRFDWVATDQAFAIGVGGTASSATVLGTCASDDLVEVAAQVARGAITLFTRAPWARRMHELVATVGVKDILPPETGEGDHGRWGRGRGALLSKIEAADAPSTTPRKGGCASNIVGLRTSDDTPTIGLAAPFGRLDSTMLRETADLAAARGTSELRLTPWRTILVPLATGVATAPAGFITDARDPRLAIAACVGREGCERGTTSTRDDATALADLGVPLHVSGCGKGCAMPSSSTITLVGRNGCYDLVRDGRAGDAPLLRDLPLAAVRAAILALGAPA